MLFRVLFSGVVHVNVIECRWFALLTPCGHRSQNLEASTIERQGSGEVCQHHLDRVPTAVARRETVCSTPWFHPSSSDVPLALSTSSRQAPLPRRHVSCAWTDAMVGRYSLRRLAYAKLPAGCRLSSLARPSKLA